MSFKIFSKVREIIIVNFDVFHRNLIELEVASSLAKLQKIINLIVQ